MKNGLALRLYIFVPYNISPIQQGIQAGHAALEYALLYGHTKLFKEFAVNHKTWIILNGGTTRDANKAIFEHGVEPGTMNSIFQELQVNKIPCAFFREPDLNYALTAVCFIADERVWNYEDYPDMSDETDVFYSRWINKMGGLQNVFLRNLIKNKHLA